MKGYKLFGWIMALGLGLLWAGLAGAQTFVAAPLTEAQYQVLKNDVLVVHQAEFAAYIDPPKDQVIADAYNLEAVPLFYAWRGKVSRLEILFGTSSEGTTFTPIDKGWMTLTLQEIEGWRELFSRGDDATSPGQPTVQAWFAEIFKGPGNAAANLAHIYAVARRPATRAERLFITSGIGTKPAPGLKGWEGAITSNDIAHALRGAPLQ